MATCSYRITAGGRGRGQITGHTGPYPAAPTQFFPGTKLGFSLANQANARHGGLRADSVPEVMRVRRTCEYCGASYVAKRSTSRFCSDKCRAAFRRKTSSTLYPAETIERAREVMRELDVLSVVGPDAYREVCAHVARGMARSLSEVGL